jgi:uncharacterized protein with ATP-grasp and redox domains
MESLARSFIRLASTCLVYSQSKPKTTRAMRSRPDCYYCSLKQALSAARAAGVDERIQVQALHAAAESMRNFDLSLTPAQNSTRALWAAQKVLGNDDPFAAQKAHFNAMAMDLYPRLKGIVERAPNRLAAAVSVAVAGNVIDLGILGQFSGHHVDIEGAISAVFTEGLAISHLPELKDALDRAPRVLYLSDNAGEIVFDRVLIEEMQALGVEIDFAVKSGPILNDVTVEDALTVGIDRIANVVETGTNEIGLPLQSASPEFRQLFEQAELIISKGQGNFESLDQVVSPIFFLLKAKCEITAAALGVEPGRMVLLHSRAWTGRD